jgi:hypothetical protein
MVFLAKNRALPEFYDLSHPFQGFAGSSRPANVTKGAGLNMWLQSQALFYPALYLPLSRTSYDRTHHLLLLIVVNLKLLLNLPPPFRHFLLKPRPRLS